jgi:hypothetical protein
MKNESKGDPRERLLGEVFAEGFGPAGPEEMRELMREFRVAHWRRRTARLMLAAAALAAFGVFAPFYLQKASKSNPTVSSARAEVVTREKVETISDEELLRFFPPDSCFLAELDGKQILVFKDARLAEEFLE